MILATFLTMSLMGFEVVGEAGFGSKSRTWTAIERAINFPGLLILHVTGQGHGFSQLVLPFLFVFLAYWLVFWLILSLVDYLSRGPSTP